MYYKMDLQDFIKVVADNLIKEYQISTEKLLMQDIIMIYNGCYSDYEHYKDIINKGNERIDEFKSAGLSFTIHPKHIILDEEIYNFILSLKLLYK